MSTTFDPYYKWLGIPHEEQPAHHYRLLGIKLFETDLQVIEAAADRQMAFLRRFQTGENGDQAKTLLNEVSRARICLLKPDMKSQYDLRLRTQLSQSDSRESGVSHGLNEIDSDSLSAINPESTQRSPKPIWQQPAALAASAMIAVSGFGGVFFLQGAGQLQTANSATAKHSNSAQTNGPADTTAGQTVTSTAGSKSARTQTASRTRDDQSRPLATGDRAPWPTLQDGVKETRKAESGKTSLSEKTVRKPTEIDLISQIDPKRDAVQGVWKVEQGCLLAPGGARDRIRIPGKVPSAYTLTIIAERNGEGGFGLQPILPIGNGQAMATIDGWDGELSGLDMVNGVQGNENETKTKGRLTKPGLNTYVCRVTPDRVRVEVNGKKAIDWQGASTLLSVHSGYAMPATDEFGIAGGWVEWKILEMKLESHDDPKPTTQLVAAAAMDEAPQGLLVEGKKSVPDAAAQEAAKKSLKELFKIDYVQAKKQEGKISLAKLLFARGQEIEDDPATCYVMLAEAADLAADAGQLGLSWDSLVALGNRFDVNYLAMMERAAKTAGPFAKSFDDVHELIVMYSNLTAETIRVNDFETAAKVALATSQIVRKPLYANLKEQVASTNKRISTMKEAFDSVKGARETLKTSPTDPAACVAWGRFLCFHKNDWAEGVPLLAKGVDPVLSTLAQRELAMDEQSPPPESKDIAQLGDDWWALSDKEKEPARSHIRDHAAESYLLAQGGAQGLEKASFQLKLDRIFGATKFTETLGDAAGATIAPAELNPGTFFAIEFWISTHATSGPLVSKRQLLEGESSLVVAMQDGVATIGSNMDFQWDPVPGKSTINDGAWHHIAAVKLGEQLLLFVDGKKEAQAPAKEKFSSKSPWKAGCSTQQEPIAVRLCRIRLSNSPRYLFQFIPEKQYGKDPATLFPK